MNRKNSHSFSSANQSNLEAFHGLASIYLAGAERLTALNLTSIRGVLDDTVAESTQRPSTKTDFGFNLPLVAFGQPSVEKTMAYSRSVYEILLETQQEIIQTLSSQFANTNANLKMPLDWSAPFEMFTKGLQEVSSLTKKNTSATTEAAKSAIAEINSRLSKAA
ncbi:phasin family protein [Ferribacterium limneticum]|uniref:phasin family protein n=1 Tax=Ferribacterium limneticum TaxID=76259 RepID=UPI001CF92879|nr:phasin family protein [Ferribacterium limneticum]UCV24346.1 phasin family protein [Ferribacterium limneticum]